MRWVFSVISIPIFVVGAAAAEITSAYTELEPDRDCAVFAAAEEGGGDWRNMICAGWRGYPILIYYSDAREALFYGFPPAGDLAPQWESFAGFNHSGPTVEWRIATDGSRLVPLATIHRWFVSAGDDDEEIEVLVVEKVGQLYEREGCVVGYVVATGNANANEKARRIADEASFGFACGADQPAIDAGDVALPMTSIAE